jgi:hypothetical protein
MGRLADHLIGGGYIGHEWGANMTAQYLRDCLLAGYPIRVAPMKSGITAALSRVVGVDQKAAKVLTSRLLEFVGEHNLWEKPYEMTWSRWDAAIRVRHLLGECGSGKKKRTRKKQPWKEDRRRKLRR